MTRPNKDNAVTALQPVKKKKEGGAKRFFKGVWNGIKTVGKGIGKAVKGTLNFINENKDAIQTAATVVGTVAKAVAI